PRERLHLEVLVEPGDAVLSPYPALLEATERYVGAVGPAAVDIQCAGADSAGYTERPVERAGVHRATEPVHALVGDADRVVVVLERDHDEHRAEDLLLGDRHRVVDVGEQRRLDEVALRQIL